MSCYNPKIYSYEALKPEHKRQIDVYDFAVQDALNREYIMDDMMGLMMEGDTVIGQLRREIAEEVFDAIEKYMGIQRQEMIVAIMDGDEDYHESDTEETKEKT